MIRVQREDFDPGAELSRLTAGRSDIGGVVSFIGLVRDIEQCALFLCSDQARFITGTDIVIDGGWLAK